MSKRKIKHRNNNLLQEKLVYIGNNVTETIVIQTRSNVESFGTIPKNDIKARALIHRKQTIRFRVNFFALFCNLNYGLYA